MSYSVVSDFEHAIAEYCRAPYCVSVNSCSSALLLALSTVQPCAVSIPCRTYCSVPNAVLLAGHSIEWTDLKWEGAYRLDPTNVWDCARRFTRGMYIAGQLMCVSFQASKILGIEQGGAILHDNEEIDAWLRRARFDGRLNAQEKVPRQRGHHCYLNPSTAALGLQHMAHLPAVNADLPHDFANLSALDFWHDSPNYHR